MARPKKTVYPDWFNANGAPLQEYGLVEPQKVLTKNTVVSKIRLEDGDEVICDPRYNYIVSIDLEHGCYPGDTYAECYLIGRISKDVENEKYDSELAAWKRKVKKFEKITEEWKMFKDLWDAEQAKKKEAKERKHYLELKKKYEQK